MNESIDCQELVQLVTAYFDGALTVDRRRIVDEHLAECEDCVHHVHQMRRTIEITGRLATDDIPSADVDTLLAAFRAGAPRAD